LDRTVMSDVRKYHPTLTYPSDLEERLDRDLSFINRTMPVNRAIALIPDAASISGA